MAVHMWDCVLFIMKKQVLLRSPRRRVFINASDAGKAGMR